MKRKPILLLVLSPLLLISLGGCLKWNDSTSTTSSSSNDGDDWATTSSCGDCENVQPEYLKLWNPTTRVNISIKMSQQAAEFINQYQSDHNNSTYFDYYVPCDVVITLNDNTYTFEEVGIRQKGNMSRTTILVGNNLSLNSLGHYKLSFKQTFDGDEYTNIEALRPFKKVWDDSSARKARKNRTLFDMEKIDIKWNRNDDETKVKQSYALKLFRENGVLAAHSTLANINMQIDEKTPINTTYEVFECIDESFIKKHFSANDASGDLYKCTYTDGGPANFSNSYTVGNQIGAEDNTTNYHPVYDLKTNKKKNTTHTDLKNLRSIINDKTSSAEQYKTNIEQYLDMTSFMRYESIAYLLGNFDDMRNNANNYYLYIPNSSKKAYIIPYDFDRCLGTGCEGRKDYMTDFSPESTKMQCNNGWQNINLYWRTVCSTTESGSGYANVERVEAYRAMYQKNIETLINNRIISNESFTSYVNSFPEEYRGNPNGAGNNNTTFSNYLSKKIQAIKDSNTKGLINYEINV